MVRSPREPNTYLELDMDKIDTDADTIELDIGVRTVKDDGRVELVLADPENLQSELASLFVRADEGSEYSPKNDNAATELADKIEEVATQ